MNTLERHFYKKTEFGMQETNSFEDADCVIERVEMTAKEFRERYPDLVL